MSSSPISTRYSRLLIALHWLTVILVVSAYALMEFKDIFPKGSAGREGMKTLHYSIGATILALTVIRLPLRSLLGAPAIEPPPPHWQQSVAYALHALLYAMLLVLPVTGWLTLNADGHAVSAWGMPLPIVLNPNESLADILKDVHESIASLGYALVGLHALAALYHHYLLGDNTLTRMLLGRRR
ncbi:cytochrome B [Pusillimonas sp. TS35]|uniref:cytochrome b n=1 Tax=Paracandidimonas lactea TaxID=2895524 RepID=UPI00136F7AD6|nr:cytochrome b [Paracandidimonas lactea]MYN11807.1 cytochrome B [Pusillimonas sp. TS35]